MKVCYALCSREAAIDNAYHNLARGGGIEKKYRDFARTWRIAARAMIRFCP